MYLNYDNFFSKKLTTLRTKTNKEPQGHGQNDLENICKYRYFDLAMKKLLLVHFLFLYIKNKKGTHI